MQKNETVRKDKKVKYPVYHKELLTNSCTNAHLTINFNSKSEHFSSVGLNLDLLH